MSEGAASVAAQGAHRSTDRPTADAAAAAAAICTPGRHRPPPGAGTGACRSGEQGAWLACREEGSELWQSSSLTGCLEPTAAGCRGDLPSRLALSVWMGDGVCVEVVCGACAKLKCKLDQTQKTNDHACPLPPLCCSLTHWLCISAHSLIGSALPNTPFPTPPPSIQPQWRLPAAPTAAWTPCSTVRGPACVPSAQLVYRRL